MDKNQFYDNFSDMFDAATEDLTPKLFGLIKKTAQKRNVSKILEMGCGTGRLTVPLAYQGFDITGIDLSKKLLEKAKTKVNGLNNINFLKKDMTNFSFKTKFGMVVCVDTLEDLTETKDLLKAFKNANKNLKKNGLFFFNAMTEAYVRKMIGQTGFGETIGDNAFVWEDSIFHDYYFIDINIFRKTKNGLYKKKKISSTRRVYQRKELEQLLKKAGFKKVRVYGSASLSKPTPRTQDLLFFAEK